MPNGGFVTLRENFILFFFYFLLTLTRLGFGVAFGPMTRK